MRQRAGVSNDISVIDLEDMEVTRSVTVGEVSVGRGNRGVSSLANLTPRAASWRARSLAIASLIAIVAGTSAPLAAAEPDDSDWPCIQRLVPELAASQMWAGPPPPDGADEMSGAHGETAQLARQLASRAMPVDQAQAAIDEFASGVAPEQRNAELTHLFHEVLQLINQERSDIIAAIKRYTRKQQHLAQKITQDSQKLANLQPGTTPDPDTQELLNEREWDLRVFHDRQRVLRQVCEQPVLMEQRAFSLSRAMQAELESN